MVDPNKSFEVSENGITIDQGVWVGSGSPVPTFSAPEGSIYYRSSPAETYVQAGPGETNNWIIFQGVSNAANCRIQFWNDSGTEDKWLRRAHHAQATGPETNSDTEPYTFPFNGNVTGYSFMNKKDSSDTDIEIYKNNVLQTTFNIRLRKWEISTNIGTISFLAGDHLSVFARKFGGGTKPEDVLLDLNITFTSDTAQTIGGATL